MKNIVIELSNGLKYDIDKDLFMDNVLHYSYARYLKGLFKHPEYFKKEFYEPMVKYLAGYGRFDRINQIKLIREYFYKVTPFSYKEAFKLSDETFRARVFGTINVREMINNLGNTRINAEGKRVTHRIYKEDGTYQMKDYDVVYEVYKIDCSSLGVSDEYCVKCWCTSTNKEQWIWVEQQYALKGALAAIASTIRVYKNMIPHIKHIKRQGDVLLFEMDKAMIPNGEIVPLTAEQYFSKLIAQA